MWDTMRFVQKGPVDISSPIYSTPLPIIDVIHAQCWNMAIIPMWSRLVTREIAHNKAKPRNIQEFISPKVQSANYKIDI